jgi:methyltransferase (TIGR00027 family)
MKNKKRIDKKSSRTAAYTCMCRASSYLEKENHFKSGDYIAVQLLPKFIKILILWHILNLRSRISPRGIYQYVIARTKYIDSILEKALANGFKQVVILGAGFDSRAIRFFKPNNTIKVFEIDTPHTQNAKIKQLKKRHIAIPENNIYVSVDFEKEDFKKRLLENGFANPQKTLFILEGLTMYLSQDTVEDTFRFIRANSAPGSLVVFDYIYASVLRRERKYYGEKAIYRRVKQDNERWTFGIEEGELENFLNQLNFKLIEHLDSNAMEHRYFTAESGNILTKVNETHCLVLAQAD